MLYSFSKHVGLIDKLLSKERLVCHSNPEDAVHLTFLIAEQILNQALRALLHKLFHVISALSFLSCRFSIRSELTKLVHEELCVRNINCLLVSHDLVNDSRSVVLGLVFLALDLTQSFLNECS